MLVRHYPQKLSYSQLLATATSPVNVVFNDLLLNADGLVPHLAYVEFIFDASIASAAGAAQLNADAYRLLTPMIQFQSRGEIPIQCSAQSAYCIAAETQDFGEEAEAADANGTVIPANGGNDPVNTTVRWRIRIPFLTPRWENPFTYLRCNRYWFDGFARLTMADPNNAWGANYSYHTLPTVSVVCGLLCLDAVIHAPPYQWGEVINFDTGSTRTEIEPSMYYSLGLTSPKLNGDFCADDLTAAVSQLYILTNAYRYPQNLSGSDMANIARERGARQSIFARSALVPNAIATAGNITTDNAVVKAGAIGLASPNRKGRLEPLYYNWLEAPSSFYINTTIANALTTEHLYYFARAVGPMKGGACGPQLAPGLVPLVNKDIGPCDGKTFQLFRPMMSRGRLPSPVLAPYTPHISSR